MTTSTRTPDATQPRGWVLYDGSCGVCRGAVGKWGTYMRRHGFEPRPAQDDWVKDHVPIPLEVLLTDMHLVLADGRAFAGADAYRHLLRQSPWFAPLYLLSSLPGLRQMVNALYRAFAGNRHHISRVCKLE